MFDEILANVKEKTPLVHNITNYVTVNDCANAVLASGGSPIMSDDINEVEDITSICSSLVINIGTLNERTVQSMIKAGKKANQLNHPVILDPVGAGASKYRTDTVFKLLNEVEFSVIRGNISEIKTVEKGSGTTKGVDADVSDTISDENLQEAVDFSKQLSDRTGAVIAITGPIDIVSNKNKSYIIRNGHKIMSKITGSGCMLTSIIGCYLGANPNNALEATAAAVCMMGICGERAYKKTTNQGGGTASFRSYLIDEISKIDAVSMKGEAKIEIK